MKKQFPRFTDEERAIMQGHTCIGANLFEPPESFLDEMCRDVALYHHERWDGGETAYPGATDFRNFVIGAPIEPARHLCGEEIPLCARIVAVADVFDALSHKRCYKDAWKIDDAFSEIQADSGKHFDPEVVLAFMQVRDRISAIQLAFPDED